MAICKNQCRKWVRSLVLSLKNKIFKMHIFVVGFFPKVESTHIEVVFFYVMVSPNISLHRWGVRC